MSRREPSFGHPHAAALLRTGDDAGQSERDDAAAFIYDYLTENAGAALARELPAADRCVGDVRPSGPTVRWRRRRALVPAGIRPPMAGMDHHRGHDARHDQIARPNGQDGLRRTGRPVSHRSSQANPSCGGGVAPGYD